MSLHNSTIIENQMDFSIILILQGTDLKPSEAGLNRRGESKAQSSIELE